MTNFSGIDFRDRAVLELIILLESNSNPDSSVGLLPVAIIACLKEMSRGGWGEGGG